MKFQYFRQFRKHNSNINSAIPITDFFRYFGDFRRDFAVIFSNFSNQQFPAITNSTGEIWWLHTSDLNLACTQTCTKNENVWTDFANRLHNGRPPYQTPLDSHKKHTFQTDAFPAFNGRKWYQNLMRSDGATTCCAIGRQKNAETNINSNSPFSCTFSNSKMSEFWKMDFEFGISAPKNRPRARNSWSGPGKARGRRTRPNDTRRTPGPTLDRHLELRLRLMPQGKLGAIIPFFANYSSGWVELI